MAYYFNVLSDVIICLRGPTGCLYHDQETLLTIKIDSVSLIMLIPLNCSVVFFMIDHYLHIFIYLVVEALSHKWQYCMGYLFAQKYILVFITYQCNSTM